MSLMKHFLAIVLFFVCAFKVAADEMETDRPDFTEGTQTVEPGSFQLEAGYTFVRNKSDGLRSTEHAFPEFLLRGGLLNDFELRVGWDGFIFQDFSATSEHNSKSQHGTTDMSLGYKQRIHTQTQTLPHFGYIFELGLPVGSEKYTSDGVEPHLLLLWAYEVSDRAGIAGNFNIAYRKGEDRFIEPAASLSLDYDLINDIGTYLEYFGYYPEGGAMGESDRHFINTGLTFALTQNFQLDWRIGIGLNKASDDMFSGVGFAWRI